MRSILRSTLLASFALGEENVDVAEEVLALPGRARGHEDPERPRVVEAEVGLVPGLVVLDHQDVHRRGSIQQPMRASGRV